MRAPPTQIKIAWSFYQICALIPDVYQVQLPVQVDEALQFFRLSIDLDAWNVHMSCCEWPPFELGTRRSQI